MLIAACQSIGRFCQPVIQSGSGEFVRFKPPKFGLAHAPQMSPPVAVLFCARLLLRSQSGSLLPFESVQVRVVLLLAWAGSRRFAIPVVADCT